MENESTTLGAHSPFSIPHSALAAAVIACLLLALAGCSGRPTAAQVGLPVVTIQIGQRTYQCEVAANEDSRRTGLMHRKSMPEDHGMIFVFKYEQVLYFWMKNTLIPLDILYLDRQGKVVAIRPLQPLDENSVGSKDPAQYAIELNAGQAAASGIKEGDVIKLPALPEAR